MRKEEVLTSSHILARMIEGSESKCKSRPPFVAAMEKREQVGMAPPRVQRIRLEYGYRSMTV
jgi:hypothetical protein